uniref:Putative signal transduction protein with Nacht domain protein n=1 Tax=Cyanothece sp. (strain PCC 7425 / ATCC 29141) TaxID=395961 RepID=B8HQ37_CYAP4
MVDWLIVWGVAQAAGVLAKPILEELVKDASKDYAKDFFKDCLKKVIQPEPDVEKEAYVKALKEFLELMEQELENAGYQAEQIKQFVQPIKHFIKNEQVAAILGQAFEPECRTLNTKVLAQTWQNLSLPQLPEDFDWELLCKLYIRKVRGIISNSEKLRAVFMAEIQAQAAENLQELAGIAPGFNLGQYAEALKEQYGNLKLESLDTTGVYYNELKLWKIFVPQNVRECQEFLPQIYEIPKDHLRRLQERGEVDEAAIAEAELERHRKVYVEQPLRPVLEVIGDPKLPVKELRKTPVQYAVILGDPGSGKSTLLQYLPLVWAERPLRELPLYPIPLLIELRLYARDKQEKKCNDILSFIHSGNITCRLNQQELHQKLKAGDAIALFDGVDEVFDPQLREEVLTDIHRFTNDYPQVRVIVTSRWLGYKAQKLRDAGFNHFMLQDLNKEQIEDFIQRWHDLTFAEGLDKARKQERLQKAIDNSKAIRELAGNPLLLTMMAILNRNQELPRDRARLYERASEVLLHQWDVEAKLLEDPKLKDLRLTIDYQDKQAMLRQVAYHMQSSEKGLAGNLITRSDLENILAQCLEPLAATQSRSVARLMIDQLRYRNFILCDLGANSFGFVHRTFLEYFCAWEFVDRFQKQQTLTFDELQDEVIGKHWQDETWHEIIRLLAGMLDAKFAGEIIGYLLEQQVNRGDFLDKSRKRLRQEGLLNLLLAADCLAEVRNKSAINSVSTRLLQALQQEAEHEQPCKLTSEAAFALITQIAILWNENIETLRWLKGCLKLGSDSFLPESAVIAISQGWKNDPDTLPWLKPCAQSNENFFVRRAAVEALVREFKDDPDTLGILKACAQSDKHEFVRSLAVEALATEFKDIPKMFNFLCDRALHDPFEREEDWQTNPRQTALAALLKNYPNQPEVLAILNDRTANDPDEQVREYARTELARLRQSQASEE